MRQFDEQAGRRLRAAAAEMLERHHVPGMSVGVVRGREVVFCEGFGFADIEARQPMDGHRRQRIASITKTMAGLCTMALVDEGKLSIDDRVVDHLPDVRFDGPGERITVRHLLTHTSGIGEAPTLGALAATIDPDHEGGDGDFSTLYPDGIVVEAEPGTKHAYANHGFALLGEIIARAEGESLGDVMRRRIFDPLGMKDTECARDPHADLTTPYHRAPSDDRRELLERAGIKWPAESTVDGHNIRGRAVANDHHGMLAAGAVQSTVPDMGRYASALLAEGAGIVRNETFGEMIGPQCCPDERLITWGLSFIRWNREGVRSFGHGGSYFGGWNSHLRIMPDADLGLIIHLNVMLDEPGPIYRRLERALLDLPEPAVPDLPLAEHVLSTAPGVYECTPGRLTNFRPSNNYGRVQITASDLKLTIRSRRGAWKDGAALLPGDAADPSFYFACTPDGDPTPVVLCPDASGRVEAIYFGDLQHMVRNDTMAPWA